MRILASNYQHQSLATSAGIVGKVWKEFENTPDWTYPSTSSLIDDTLGKVSAGGNLSAGKLTLPKYKRMRDFVPSEGVKVFIATDNVTLLGSNPKQKDSWQPTFAKNFVGPPQ